jgi:hypothetical protein
VWRIFLACQTRSPTVRQSWLRLPEASAT